MFHLDLLMYTYSFYKLVFLQDLITSLIYNNAIKDLQYDHVCGVPYTALPIATLLSVKARRSMLMRRKETKAYGTKKSIEGHYKNGQKCLIIEDVVTSGSSVLETVKDLRKEGLVVTNTIVILDREQGGSENLTANDVETKSLFTMSRLMEILHKNGKITETTVSKVQKYLEECRAPAIGTLSSSSSLNSYYVFILTKIVIKNTLVTIFLCFQITT